MVSIDAYLPASGRSAKRAESAAHQFLLDNRHGFLNDEEYARVTGAHPLARLGDEAFMINLINSDGDKALAKLLVRWRNAFVLIDYGASNKSSADPGDPNFMKRTPASPQYTEAAATAAAHDVLDAIR
ncbi:hypothetical protein [Actinoallomurus sp. NPDC050550]|uniref:hypothetical protein n=1 Tax=Actinoallomurus sp. NPDC050550 TaxID=3154937 RepID=UPI0033E7A561